MREIKFRAWDLRDSDRYGEQIISRMIFDIQLTYDDKNSASFGEILDSPECFIVEQFTGLRDKNGKEIYEGDIVCFDDSECGGEKIVYLVEFGKGTYDSGMYPFQGFYLNPELEYNWHEDHNKMFEGLLEIIGNIHGNPQLLTKD